MQQSAFDSVKEILSKAPVLSHPNSTSPFILENDASNFAVGAVLLQADEKGVEKPVCYFSQKMTHAETNYPIYNMELLEIVAAFGEWQYYLLYARHMVTIRTDHKALEYHKAPQRMNQRQAHCHLELRQLDFKIEYKPGKLNILPNILSRDPSLMYAPQALDQFNTGTMLPPHRFALINGNTNFFRSRVLLAQSSSPLANRIMDAHAKSTLKKAFTSYSVVANTILHNGKLWIPPQIFNGK